MALDWTLDELMPAERPLLERLLQLYLYDFSEFDHDQVDADGRYTYFDAELPDFLSKPEYRFLLVRVDGQPAGFALIRREAGTGGGSAHHYLYEFFIMRAFRRRGLGREVAFALFDRYPGRWEVGEIAANAPAVAFWRRVIGDYTGGHYRERQTDTPGSIQSFTTRKRDQS